MITQITYDLPSGWGDMDGFSARKPINLTCLMLAVNERIMALNSIGSFFATAREVKMNTVAPYRCLNGKLLINIHQDILNLIYSYCNQNYNNLDFLNKEDKYIPKWNITDMLKELNTTEWYTPQPYNCDNHLWLEQSVNIVKKLRLLSYYVSAFGENFVTTYGLSHDIQTDDGNTNYDSGIVPTRFKTWVLISMNGIRDFGENSSTDTVSSEINYDTNVLYNSDLYCYYWAVPQGYSWYGMTASGFDSGAGINLGMNLSTDLDTRNHHIKIGDVNYQSPRIPLYGDGLTVNGLTTRLPSLYFDCGIETGFNFNCQ